MTRYELSINMDYLEKIREQLGEMIVDHSVLTDHDMLETLYNFSSILYLILSDLKYQKDEVKSNDK